MWVTTSIDAGNAPAFVTCVNFACHTLRLCPAPVFARIQSYVPGGGANPGVGTESRAVAEGTDPSLRGDSGEPRGPGRHCLLCARLRKR